MFGKKELTIPLGPRVVFTRSAIAIAPMKDACMPNRDFNISTVWTLESNILVLLS